MAGFSLVPTCVQDILDSNIEKMYIQGYVEMFNYLSNWHPTPISINVEKNKSKITWAIADINEIIDRKDMKKTFFLRHTPEFGDGGRTGRGANNRGKIYEIEVLADLQLFSKILHLDYNYKHRDVVLYVYEKILKGKKNIDVYSTAEKNSRRPMVFSDDGGIYLMGKDINQGESIADITIEADGDTFFLSLKYGKDTRAFNAGITQYLKETEMVTGVIENLYGKQILDLFGIGESEFTSVFKNYKKGRPADRNKEFDDVTDRIDLEKVFNFICSGFGFGYFYINSIDEKTHKFIDFRDNETVKSLCEIESVKIYYPKGQAKNVDVLIETKGLKLILSFRNARSKVWPTVINGTCIVK